MAESSSNDCKQPTENVVLQRQQKHTGKGMNLFSNLRRILTICITVVGVVVFEEETNEVDIWIGCE